MTAPVARRGFTMESLAELIERRDEPEWMRERRRAAWQTYLDIPMPTRQDEEWRRTDLRRLKLDDVEPYSEGAQASKTLVPPAERNEVFGGFLGLRDAQSVEYHLSDDLTAKGVIFTDLQTAVRGHGDLVRAYFMTRCVPASDSKFAALHGAFWDNGVFLYVPRGVSIKEPLRAVTQANLQGRSSLGHTLVVLDADSQAIFAEDFISSEGAKQGFSSRVIEID